MDKLIITVEAEKIGEDVKVNLKSEGKVLYTEYINKLSQPLFPSTLKAIIEEYLLQKNEVSNGETK